MPWIPDWRIIVGSTTYNNVQSVNFTTGRIDIDRQVQAGYSRMEILNYDNAPFDIDVTDSLTLELKDTAGVYVPVFGGNVSDFTVSVRSPEEAGFITVGSILAVGELARLPKAIYSAAIPTDFDGNQIKGILNDLVIDNWLQVPAALTWAAYDPTITWANAENVEIGEIDAGLYEMVGLAAADRNIQTIVTQIADNALGLIYENKSGQVCYADADHRQTYLAANGSVELDGNYAYPTSVKSLLQIGRIRNSLIVNYGNNYNTQYTITDPDSILLYGRYQRAYDSNVKKIGDITDIADREIALRSVPRTQLDQITFRLDNPSMSNAMIDSLINLAFNDPVVITNLPFNMFEGYFSGFVEGISVKATPTYADMTLFISPTDFSLIAPTWATVIPTNTIWSGVTATLQWSKAIGAIA